MSEMRAGDNMGFSVGGAKDIANFRENIKQGYLPLPTDITYEDYSMITLPPGNKKNIKIILPFVCGSRKC